LGVGGLWVLGLAQSVKLETKKKGKEIENGRRRIFVDF
jgi:hypothetical protein